LLASGVFFFLMVLQSRFLPRAEQNTATRAPSVLEGLGEVLSNRLFLLFAVAMLGQFTLMNQLYLGLPLEIERLTGGQSPVGALFTVSAILTIALQVPVTALLRRRWPPARAMALGLGLMASAFIPPLAGSLLLADAASDSSPGWLSTDALRLLPVMLSAGILALGIMIANPFALESVPRLGHNRLTATYFGVFSMASGIGATLGNLTMGYTFEKQADLNLMGPPWLVMVAIGGACAALMLVLGRRPELAEPRGQAERRSVAPVEGA